MIDYKQKLKDIIMTSIKKNASDIHLSVGHPVITRIDNMLRPLNSGDPVLANEDVEGLVYVMLTSDQKERLTTSREIDLCYKLENNIRIRVNIYFQQGFITAAMRLIPVKVRAVDELNLPPILHDLAKLNQGFILVVGPSGQGKSTTLAALINEINIKRTEHIITIEDPIEYLFREENSIISQREIGDDTNSFTDAMRSVLRQDPDVIMIGEMRDAETISTALTAAETGHLVLSTLHTNSASQTLDRIIDSFPSQQQNQIVSQLASTLGAIISQRLIPRIGGGRVPAVEILLPNAAIRSLIREKKIYQIDSAIETGSQRGMISLNRSLIDLIKTNDISYEDAELFSLNPSTLRALYNK